MLEMNLQRDADDPKGDRRAHPRIRISRPCKVHDPRSGKYLTAQTHDLSASGVLVEIDRPLDIAPGEALYVGIAQKRRQVLLRAHDMIRIRVVRAVETLSGGTFLAGRWGDEAVTADELRLAA